MTEALALWWTRKYKLPSNHELFQSRTIFDLLVEFYIDRFQEKPIEVHRNADGEIQFTDTGDELIDKWEQQIADGELPDLWEAFDEESLERLKKLRAAAELRDPYQGFTMKNTFERVQTQAKREGLTVGRETLTEDERRALAARLLSGPLFNTGLDDDE